MARPDITAFEPFARLDWQVLFTHCRPFAHTQYGSCPQRWFSFFGTRHCCAPRGPTQIVPGTHFEELPTQEPPTLIDACRFLRATKAARATTAPCDGDTCFRRQVLFTQCKPCAHTQYGSCPQRWCNFIGKRHCFAPAGPTHTDPRIHNCARPVQDSPTPIIAAGRFLAAIRAASAIAAPGETTPLLLRHMFCTQCKPLAHTQNGSCPHRFPTPMGLTQRRENHVPAQMRPWGQELPPCEHVTRRFLCKM